MAKQISIDVFGKIVVARLKGTYSVPEADRFYKALRKTVDAQSKPIGIVMELTQFQGSPPEGYQIAEAFNQWLTTQNIVAKVNVMTPQITSKIVEQNIPTRKKLNLEVFDTEQEAIAYLETLLSS